MDFKQHAETCEEHADCTVIRYIRSDGWQAWESHAHKDTHIGCRIGDASPECEDRTGKKPTLVKWVEMCDACRDHFTKVT